MSDHKVTAVHKQFPYWANRPLFWLVGIMIAVYIPTHLPNIFAVPKDGSFSDKIMEWGLMQGSAVFQHGQYWRLLTAAFLHANIWHILFNMMAFIMFGVFCRQYERSKYAWLWMFFIGAVVGNVAIGLLKPDAGAVGASGGIMALWGGYFAIVLRAYAFKSPELGHVRHVMSLRSEVISLALQVVLFDHLIKNIGWQCHLGGLITGIVIGMVVPLRGQLYVYASRKGVANFTGDYKLVTRKVKGRGILDVEHDIEIVQEEFDPSRDFVVTSSTYVDWRNQAHQRVVRVLAGHLPKNHDWDNFEYIARIPTVKELEHYKKHTAAAIVKSILDSRNPSIPHHTIHED